MSGRVELNERNDRREVQLFQTPLVARQVIVNPGEGISPGEINGGPTVDHEHVRGGAGSDGGDDLPDRHAAVYTCAISGVKFMVKSTRMFSCFSSNISMA